MFGSKIREMFPLKSTAEKLAKMSGQARQMEAQEANSHLERLLEERQLTRDQGQSDLSVVVKKEDQKEFVEFKDPKTGKMVLFPKRKIKKIPPPTDVEESGRLVRPHDFGDLARADDTLGGVPKSHHFDGGRVRSKKGAE